MLNINENIKRAVVGTSTSVEFIREYRPNYFNNNSEQDFKNFVKQNYFNYLCQ